MKVVTLAAWSAALFLSSSLFSHDVALRLILLACTIGFASAAVARSRERASLDLLPPIWLPFLLWGTWAALSLAWSIDPALTQKEVRNEVIYTALALLACHVAAQAPRAERIFLPVTGVAAILLCANALFDFRRSPLLTPEGWHGGQGNLSGLLLIVLPCVVMAGWYAVRTDRRYFVIGAVAIASLVLVAAYTALNRTVWIGFTLQGLLSLVLILLRPSAKPKAAGLKIAALAGALVLTLGGGMTVLTHEERVASNDAKPLEHDPRIALWSAALPLAKQHPLTGYGFGRGMLHAPLLEATGNPMLWHSHNLFIDAALQTGFPGLVLLLILLGSTVMVGWRLTRSSSDRKVACGIALLGVVAGTVVRNMTDLVFQRHVALTYWAVVAVLIAWGCKSETSRTTREKIV